MTILFIWLAGLLLAMTLAVVIFSTTSNDKEVQAFAGSAIRWALVWMMLFMSMIYIHGLQEELETYKSQEQVYGEN